MSNKPRLNYGCKLDELHGRDLFQTPSYALDPLLPFIQQYDTVWESACGEGYLVRALQNAGKRVIYSDLQLGQNYFESDVPDGAQIQITNVPFSKKYQWVAKAVEQDIPFALLMPADVIWAAKRFWPYMFEYNLQLLVPDKRINYKAPNKGWLGADGKKTSSQNHSAWVCKGLNLPERIYFETENRIIRKDELPLENVLCPN